jgi:hypothetical protein
MATGPRSNSPDTGMPIERALANKNWGMLRQLLRQHGWNLPDFRPGDKGFNQKGAGLARAADFYMRGKNPQDFNEFQAMLNARNAPPARNPGQGAKPKPKPAPRGGGGAAGGGAFAGMVEDIPGVTSDTQYLPFSGMGGEVPGLIKVGTLMGRNPFGPGFGFNPAEYARNVTDAKYNPQLVSMANQIKLEQELSGAAEGRLNAAYDPLIQKMQEGADKRLAASTGLRDSVLAMAGDLGGLGGQATAAAAANQAGMASDLSQIGFSDDMSRKESAARDKANVLAGFLAERNSAIRGVRGERDELLAGRGADYRQALIEGMGLRSNLQEQAIGARGALLNQNMTKALGESTLAQSNIQAQSMMDEMLRARGMDKRERREFLAQMSQFDQQSMMNDLQMQGMVQDLQGQPGLNMPVNQMKAEQKSELWSYLLGLAPSSACSRWRVGWASRSRTRSSARRWSTSSAARSARTLR